MVCIITLVKSYHQFGKILFLQNHPFVCFSVKVNQVQVSPPNSTASNIANNPLTVFGFDIAIIKQFRYIRIFCKHYFSPILYLVWATLPLLIVCILRIISAAIYADIAENVSNKPLLETHFFWILGLGYCPL